MGNISYYNQDGGVTSIPPNQPKVRTTTLLLPTLRQKLAGWIYQTKVRVLIEQDGRIRLAIAGAIDMQVVDKRNL